jgi:hypothetical protein
VTCGTRSAAIRCLTELPNSLNSLTVSKLTTGRRPRGTEAIYQSTPTNLGVTGEFAEAALIMREMAGEFRQRGRACPTHHIGMAASFPCFGDSADRRIE